MRCPECNEKIDKDEARVLAEHELGDSYVSQSKQLVYGLLIAVGAGAVGFLIGALMMQKEIEEELGWLVN